LSAQKSTAGADAKTRNLDNSYREHILSNRPDQMSLFQLSLFAEHGPEEARRYTTVVIQNNGGQVNVGND